MKISLNSISSFLLFLLILATSIPGQVRSTASVGIRINVVNAASVSLNNVTPDEKVISVKSEKSKLRDVIVNYKLVSVPGNKTPRLKDINEDVDFMIADSQVFMLNREGNLNIKKIDRTQNLNISYNNSSLNRKSDHKIAVTIVY